MLKTCRERNDDWSQTVLGRLEYLRDFHAADAVYQQTCNINFRTGKNILKQCSADLDNDAKRCKTQGRPVDTVPEKLRSPAPRKGRNVVTFKHTVVSIVHEFYVQPRCDDLKEEDLRIVEAAAKLVKREIMVTFPLRTS